MSYTVPPYHVGDHVRYQGDGELYQVRVVHNDIHSPNPATYDIYSPTSGKTLTNVAEAMLSKDQSNT